MQAVVYNTAGKKTGTVALPPQAFGVPWNATLVHEVVRGMQGNARASTAHTKTRAEVRGGGRKPWRQKGTGRARHGSRRSPIWRGGGVTFGPRSARDYSVKLNRAARAKALGAVLSQKIRDSETIFLDTLSFPAPKTKEAKEVLVALSGIKGNEMLARKRKNAALVVLPARDAHSEKSFRNFGNVLVKQAKDINPVDLLTYKYAIMAGAEQVVSALTERLSPKAKKTASRKTTAAIIATK